MKNEITGVILAGGKSSRMGTEKGLLLVNGKRIIERVIERLKAVTKDIIIISNGTTYNYLGYKVYPDIIKNCGPMGGIYTALSVAVTDKVMLVSCDMPFLNVEIFQHIINEASGFQVALPEHDGMLEPLCAVYDRACLETFHLLLESGQLKMQDVVKHFKANVIPMPKNIFGENCFANINTPEDFDHYKL